MVGHLLEEVDAFGRGVVIHSVDLIEHDSKTGTVDSVKGTDDSVIVGDGLEECSD